MRTKPRLRLVERPCCSGSDREGPKGDQKPGFSIPEIENWARRVGAVQVSMRKYAVKTVTEGRYPRHVAEARITKDGKFEFSGDDDTYAPTKEENELIEAAITEAIKADKFPKSIAAGKAEAKNLIATLDGDCFLFLDPTGKTVLFVHQYKYNENGEKDVLPWSYWNDGRWRMLEPDGLLPVFGQEQIKDEFKIIIHEGAKAAAHIQALVDNGGAELASHPWASDLRDAAHIAWPGGVRRVRDVDWEKLKKLLKDKRVILVCDNDQGGVNAVKTISSILKLPLSFIRFGDGFSEGFDLGDDFAKEKKLWEEKKGRLTWVGPSFEDCLSPATWATESKEPVGKGKPPIFLREEFVKEWMYAVKPMTFVNRLTMRRYAKDEFNALIAPFSDAVDIAERLRKWPSSAAETLAYEPGKKAGLTPTRYGMAINMHRPSDVKPVKGDEKLWHEFMAQLIPNDDDRSNTMKWCATMIAKPSARMHYSVLLISEEQGVGKSTLGEEIMRPLVGASNCSGPTAAEATNPQFTSWAIFKRLAIINEIYDGDSSKAYNRLKTVLTDPLLRAQEKYEKPFDVPNWVHVFACSNSFRALKLAANDRRWFVPEVTEEKWPHAKWTEFYTWIGNEGLSVICHWAHEYVKQHGHVEPGIEAPFSAAKQRSIMAGLGDGEQIIHDLGTSLMAMEKEQVVRLDKIRPWLALKKSADPRYGTDGSRYLEAAETIARTLKSTGLTIFKKRLKEDGKQFQVAANFQVKEEETWLTLKDRCLTPADAYFAAKREEEAKEPY